jgi:hypothetical protein
VTGPGIKYYELLTPCKWNLENPVKARVVLLSLLSDSASILVLQITKRNDTSSGDEDA